MSGITAGDEKAPRVLDCPSFRIRLQTRSWTLFFSISSCLSNSQGINSPAPPSLSIPQKQQFAFLVSVPEAKLPKPTHFLFSAPKEWVGGKSSIIKRSGWVGNWKTFNFQKRSGWVGNLQFLKRSGWVGNPETLKGVGGWETLKPLQP